ncbi:MAG TPA: sulfotransferase [Byssovorax sp.]|jgi:hypothetical protein
MSASALDAVLDGYAALPLTRFGRLIAEGTLLEAIGRRLRLGDDLDTTPSVAARALEAPVFVASPFRTGTTLTHRLLALHPRLRALAPWETAYAPPPLAGPARRDDDRRARVERSIAAMRARSPDVFRLHPVEVDAPEECFPLLESSLLSPSFAFHAAPRGYEHFVARAPEAAWAEAYRVYADELRCIDVASERRGDPPRRFVLKGATHLDGLAALLAELPGARVIQLHRAPLDCVTSLARLYAAHHRMYVADVDTRNIGRLALSTTRAALARACRARRAAEPSRFLDVAFGELARDPVATAARMLAFAEVPAEPRAIEAMRAYVASHPAPHARPDDAPADAFGLDRDEVEAAFADYDAFGG